jgi:mono/diheme cytochrome c family protein
MSTGGTSTGGSNTTGGSTGGSNTGGGFGKGGTTSGGSNTGGKNSTGGKSFGGASSGGSSTGGSSVGGASTGGSGGATGATFASLCATCHGQKGEGVAMKGPEIQHPVRDFATWVVRNGRQGNPSFPGQTMAAFPASALPDATLTSFFDALSTPTLPKPTTGAALYTDYCANCHSATGTGGTAGHNAKGQPLSKALSMVRGGHSLTQFSVRNGYMPKWSTSELTDAEVGLIVTHLDSL